MKRTSVAVAVALIALALPASAQTGLFVGAQVTGSSLSSTVATASTKDFEGAGFGVHAGLTLGSTLGVLVNYDQTGDVNMGQMDVLGRLGFIRLGPVKTYLEGGLTARMAKVALSSSSAIKENFKGSNPTAGVGASVFLLKKLSLDGSMLWTFGKFGPSGATVNATGSRVSLGASLYLLGGK